MKSNTIHLLEGGAELKPPPGRGFDVKCLELADYFLPNGSVDDRWALADEIQIAIESWLGAQR